jgi:hypothetical protein
MLSGKSLRQRRYSIKGVAFILLLILVTASAYSNTLNADFHLDDHPNIMENPLLRDLDNFLDPSKVLDNPEYPQLHTRYIGYLSLAINYRAHGLDVRGYHVVNISMHLLCSVLVYWLVLLTLKTPLAAGLFPERYRHEAALVAAAFFALHPIQTQAVTYITQRFALLVALFYLLSLALYIQARFLDSGKTAYALYALSVLSAIAAMFSKENAFTLPVMAAIYELVFLRAVPAERIKRLAPLFLTMLIIPLLRIASEGGLAQSAMIRGVYYERWEYLFTQFTVIVKYMQLVLLPAGLNVDYNWPLYTTFFAPEVIVAFLMVASVFLLGLWLMIRAEGQCRWRQPPGSG